jgi:hypothetical protein
MPESRVYLIYTSTSENGHIRLMQCNTEFLTGKSLCLSWVRGSHRGDYEESRLLGYSVESQLTFWRIHFPPKRRLTFNGLHGVIQDTSV